jgi:hypothetical protein
MVDTDPPRDDELRAAWNEFCDRLRDAGELVFKEVNPATGRQRADGFRYLTQNLSQAFDLALETKDTRWPQIHRFCAPDRKLGSDNGDAVYLQAWIDGESVYRISGNRGSARFFNVTVQGRRPETGALHEPFGDTPAANLLGSELATAEDGSFELYVGGEERSGNWLPTAPDSRKLFIRQFFDRWEEEPATLVIERVDMEGPPPPATPDRVMEAMRWAGTFVYDVVDYWPDHLWRSGALCNPEAVNRFDSANYRAAHDGTARPPDEQELRRGRLLTQMRWALEAEDSLVVTFDGLDSFWMVTNEGIFGNSMDYRYRSVTWTPSRASVDDDGKVRLVLAHTDPGWGNWVDTTGYAAGVLTFRNVLDPRLPVFDTEVVPHARLRDVLPASGRFVDAGERRAQLLERFRAVHRRNPA